MSIAFDHVHIYCRDLDASLRFYREVLGADEIGTLASSDPRKSGVHLHLLGGQYLALSSFPPDLAPQPLPKHGDGALDVGHGVAHLGLNVSSLEPYLARLEDAGVDVHSGPRGDGAIRFVYFTAPDGVVIELTQYVVPSHLRPAIRALERFNRGVHLAKRAIGRQLVARAG